MHVAPQSNVEKVLTSRDSVYRDMGEAAGINRHPGNSVLARALKILTKPLRGTA